MSDERCSELQIIKSYLTFVFRIGRTGRTGQTGRFRSVSFFLPGRDDFFAPCFMRYLIDSNAMIPEFFQKLTEEQHQKELERKRMAQNETSKVMAERLNKLSLKPKKPVK